MSRVYLCFLWHMHQPFYKDLLSGEYQLPWTRMHALKDYYGMVRILEEFPGICQTFNLVPSMMVQIEEYASGQARDPFLELALKPAESLTPEEQGQILRQFFHANPARMINRYPRYRELYEASRAQRDRSNGVGLFGAQEYRDLQVLSQLAWFDEYYQDSDKTTIELIRKGRHYSLDDQVTVGRKEQELVSLVIPEYKKLAASGQVEISTTPFYHPILPLLCDSSIARISHPGVPLPNDFRYPDDARRQLVMARDYTERVFGIAPVGLWPSEGSVSDQVFELAADVGFRWAATDNGILDRTLGYGGGVENTYRPWKWRQGSRELGVIFRDHLMSDLIGFVYSGMPARDAAQDFLHRIRENCRGILSSGRDALVPIILDGENAWEYYDRAGRPFFRELYSGILADPQMEAIKVCDAFEKIPSAPLDHIFPGSWINANFDIWIGDKEDNHAWNFLLAARQAYDLHPNVPEAQRKLAFEELLIAEGSDWCWCYGPEHETANREEFDSLFRAHIANVYRALGIPAPEDLSRPILRVDIAETQTSPTGFVDPKVDGLVSSYFEWLPAGLYKVSARGGAMHGKRFLVKDVHYGTNDKKLFLCFDFAAGAEDLLQNLEVRILVQGCNEVVLKISDGSASLVKGGGEGVECAYLDVLEVGIPLPAAGRDVEFQTSFWHDGLPVDAVPVQNWLTIPAIEAAEWAV
jgi:alpha-amylase/alpha-mannosidase (GH57 family)